MGASPRLRLNLIDAVTRLVPIGARPRLRLNLIDAVTRLVPIGAGPRLRLNLTDAVTRLLASCLDRPLGLLNWPLGPLPALSRLSVWGGSLCFFGGGSVDILSSLHVRLSCLCLCLPRLPGASRCVPLPPARSDPRSPWLLEVFVGMGAKARQPPGSVLGQGGSLRTHGVLGQHHQPLHFALRCCDLPHAHVPLWSGPTRIARSRRAVLMA